MIELLEGIILSKGAPKEPVSFSLEKGKANFISLDETYKFNFLKLKNQALDKGTFKIDDITIFPNESDENSLFFLQVNSLVKIGLCFVVPKDQKKEKVKQVQQELITLRDLPLTTKEEENAKIAAIFAKIKEFLPSYILIDKNDEGNKDNEFLDEQINQYAEAINIIVLEQKPEPKEEDVPTEEKEIETPTSGEKEEELYNDEIIDLNIGEVTTSKVEKIEYQSDKEDFIVFTFTKNHGKDVFTTFKNNAMVFFSFLIPTIGVISFLLLSPLYMKTDNKVLVIPFSITIAVCFVLYLIMTIRCTGFYINKKDPFKKKKILIFNIWNFLITVLGVGLGVVIYILFKTFDTDLKALEGNTIGIVLSVIFGVILLTANFYSSILFNKIKKLFKKKK